MVGVPPARDDEQSRLTDARGEFVATLPRRLDVVRAALTAFAEAPADRERLNGLLRRLHALGASARVLGLSSVADVLTEAEQGLRRALKPGQHAVSLQETARALDLIPSLVQGAGTARAANSAALELTRTLLVVGAERLAEALAAEHPGRYELKLAEDFTSARDIARSDAPDALILDGDQRGAREWLERLRADPLIELPAVVLGTFSGPEAAGVFAAAGAQRVLVKPVSPSALEQALDDMFRRAPREPGPREPLGELSVAELSARIAIELQKGLVDSLEPGSDATRVNFGDGADVLGAVWGAVARLRELVTVRSSGQVRFQATGPGGAIPLAPWLGDERRSGERVAGARKAEEDVSLRGRRVVVADDDPAVVWFLSGLFKAVGAEVLEAHDGERALDLTFQSLPDLVVSDVLMPRRDGFSLCHEIKRDVAVRDVPVILLSWKEDLLQRVRELGAPADGYLRKEANASVVIERVHEVLRTRSRIEQRLMSGGEVRGRLDGITPRLILELACKVRPDALLTFRDAVYLYEVVLRGGRVRSLSRSAPDGNFERGPRVIAGLLGVNAGRFSLQNEAAARQFELDTSLRDLIDEPVRRARGALAALGAQSLSNVLRVGVDLQAIGRYLACTPESARALIDRLAHGDSPRALLLTGQASPWLLEAVLSDLARRGAILDIERDASSAFERAPTTRQTPESYPSPSVPPPSAAPELLAAPELPAEPDPSVQMAVSAAPVAPVPPADESDFSSLSDGWGVARGAPGDTRLSSAQVTDAAEPNIPVQASVSAPVGMAAVPERGDSERPEAWFGGEARAAGSRSSELLASEESESVFDALTALEPEPVQPAARTATPAGLGPVVGLPDPKEQPQRVGLRPVLRANTRDRASPSMADVFAAALEEQPFSASEPPPEASVPPPADTEALEPRRGRSEMPTTTLVSAVGDLAPRAPAELSPAATISVQLAPSTLAEPERTAQVSHEPAEAGPRTLRIEQLPDLNFASTLNSEFGVVQRSAPRAEATVALIEPTRPEHPAMALAETLNSQPSPAPRESLTDTAVDPPRSELESSGATSGEPAASVPVEFSQPPAVQAKAVEASRPVLTPEPAPVKKSSEPVPTPASRSKDPVPVAARPRSRASERAEAKGSSKESAAPAKKSEASEAGGCLQTVALIGAAFFGAYAIFHWGVVPLFAPSERGEPPAPVASAPPPLPSAARAPSLKVEELALPTNLDPGAGRGLLELVAADGDGLYLDKTFVGRGPVRLVPANAGPHEIKITRNELEITGQVQALAGRRLRVSLELPSVPAKP